MAYDTGVQNPKYNNGILEDPLKNLLRQSKKVHNNHTQKKPTLMASSLTLSES